MNPIRRDSNEKYFNNNIFYFKRSISKKSIYILHCSFSFIFIGLGFAFSLMDTNQILKSMNHANNQFILVRQLDYWKFQLSLLYHCFACFLQYFQQQALSLTCLKKATLIYFFQNQFPVRS